MSELTTQQEREYVEARWELVVCCDGSYRGYRRGTILLQDVIDHWLDFHSWHAAYLFTLDRERQIAEVEEEIEFVRNTRFSYTCQAGYEKKSAPQRRILAAEQQRLDALKQGWKGGK